MKFIFTDFCILGSFVKPISHIKILIRWENHINEQGMMQFCYNKRNWMCMSNLSKSNKCIRNFFSGHSLIECKWRLFHHNSISKWNIFFRFPIYPICNLFHRSSSSFSKSKWLISNCPCMTIYYIIHINSSLFLNRICKSKGENSIIWTNSCRAICKLRKTWGWNIFSIHPMSTNRIIMIDESIMTSEKFLIQETNYLWACMHFNRKTECITNRYSFKRSDVFFLYIHIY